MAEPNLLKLISWNVNGIRAVLKKGFYDWLSAEQPDILGLQETKISADQLTLDLVQPPGGYQTFWSHAEKRGYSGVSIFSKSQPLAVSEGLQHHETGLAGTNSGQFDTEGRVLRADYPDFTLFNIYYPNGQRSNERLAYKMAFYDAFLEVANTLRDQGKKLVICGDFNTAHTAIDLARPKENETVSGFLPMERAWLDKFVAHGYVDTFRVFHPDEREHYSWWNMRSRARERNVGWRIDYFFVSENLRPQLHDARILPEVQGSDHCPVVLELKV